MLRNILLSISTLLTLTLFAQNGSISGTITDGTDPSNPPLPDVDVFIEGTSYGAYTDFDGKFTIENVTPGKYDIIVSDLMLGDQIIEGIKVEAGQDAIADHKMIEKVNEEEVLTIVLTKNEESESAAVNDMKETEEVVEIVSNEEMSKKGDSKASDAAKRVSGVTIVEGKYAFIRGLSDRYSKTLLNGAEIPGLDPDRVAVQLDLFPSLFIQSMNVVKSFSPDLPGDFTGGLVDIKTRESFDSLTIKASVGFSYNPQVHMRDDFLLYQGGGTDWLGFDDGTRDFTPDVNAAIALGEESFPRPSDVNNTEDKAEFEKFNNSLNPQMEPEERTVPLDHNFNITMGNSKSIKRRDSLSAPRTLGYFVGLNYRRSYSYYNDGTAGRYVLENTTDLVDSLFEARNINMRRGSDNVLLGTIGNVFYRFNPNHKISLNYIHNHTGTSIAQFGQGFDEQTTEGDFRVRKLEYVQRSMNTGQLSGEHTIDTLFFKSPTKIEWLGSYTISKQARPDLRFIIDEYVQNEDGTEIYRLKKNVTDPTRFRRDMTQESFDLKLNLTKEFTIDSLQGEVKMGGSYVSRKREFGEVRLLYLKGDPDLDYNGNGNDLISDLTFTVDTTGFDRNGNPIIQKKTPVYLQSQFRYENQYVASQNIYATYLMTKFPLSKKLKLTTGARLEITDIFVDSEKRTSNGTSDDPTADGTLKNTDILPAANFTYTFFKKRIKPFKNDSTKFKKQDLKVQAIYSRTLARPTFREISPFISFAFTEGYTEIGNPELQRVLIDNFDLRLEYYPNSGELISFSGFYKKFTNPIERVGTIAANEFTWVNAESAQLFGLEAEYRKTLGFIGPEFEKFKLGVNGSLIQSKVEITAQELSEITQGDPNYSATTRPLLGQSPYIFNTFLGCDLDSIGLSMNLTLNMFGDRMVAVQQLGTPNLYEKGREELNFNISKKVGQLSKITFRIRNILNPDYTVFHKFQGSNERYDAFNENGPYIFTQYKKGRRYSLSYSMTF